MSSAKEKIKNLKDELGYGAAVTMAVVGGLTGTLKVQAAERTSPQTVNVQEKSVDNGLDRNAAVRDGRSGKTKRVYDWQDVVSKYKLDAKSFENGAKPTKENAAMLSAIIEYEATRPNAVAETYFFRDLSGSKMFRRMNLQLWNKMPKTMPVMSTLRTYISKNFKIWKISKNVN